jgi:poly-gamma-glutamate capsule biosynthesis protein CapA/YwtB (metallophosphatase superfamily)
VTVPVTLFLCGDVMTGRGIDQIMPHPSAPQLFESCVSSAVTYVELAERAAGPVPLAVGFDYIWGDALAELERVRPDARIVNLETAITTSDAAWPGKGIHYRMHPANLPCLTAAGIDCCVLANNHVLDWGRSGLAQTLATLHAGRIRTAGAGANAKEAAAPAVIDHSASGRVLVFGVGIESSGVPRQWRATQRQSGVNWIDDLSAHSAERIARQIAPHKRPGDVVVASLHWGGNWGYAIAEPEREFAHRLIDAAGVDVVHGHSSHHVKGIEVYRSRPIFYGCGDLLTDYEGISGRETFRGDLALMYFVTVDADSGELLRVCMTPTHMHRLRINRATPENVAWLSATLSRECARLGTTVTGQADGTLALQWDRHAAALERSPSSLS